MKVGGWVALGFAAVIAYPQLSRINWGYHEESGQMMAGMLADPFHSHDKTKASALASEVCGDVVTFDTEDKSIPWIAMPEQAKVKYFFFNGRFRNIIWLGVGWKDRFCLARYQVTMRDEGEVSSMPLRLFPPIFRWFPKPVILERRFIERLANRPKVPDGVRSIFPGECVSGEIAKGGTLRFQVEVPNLGQKVELILDWDHRNGPELAVELKRNGQLLADAGATNGGGLYEITLQAPTSEAKHYRISLQWDGYGVCPFPGGWVPID